MTDIEINSGYVKRGWSDADISELEILRKGGASYEEIVRRTGRSMGSVASMLRRLGLQKSGVKTVDQKPRPVVRLRPLPPLKTVFMNPADKRAGR